MIQNNQSNYEKVKLKIIITTSREFGEKIETEQQRKRETKNKLHEKKEKHTNTNILSP